MLRTSSNHIIAEIARCVEFFHMSSGWFACTEPSLTTVVLEIIVRSKCEKCELLHKCIILYHTNFNVVTRPLSVHMQSMDTVMALLKFFSKSSSSLPSAKETGIGEAATKEAKVAVSWVLTEKIVKLGSAKQSLVHLGSGAGRTPQ